MTTEPSTAGEQTFGQRLRDHRERGGKTRAVLGGLVGRSVRYSPAARAIVDDLQAAPPKAIRDDVRTLATKVGLDAT